MLHLPNPSSLIANANRLRYKGKFASVGSGLSILGKFEFSGKGKLIAGNNLTLLNASFWTDKNAVVTLGNNVALRGVSFFTDENAVLTLGNNVQLMNNAQIYTRKQITIKDEALIGNQTVIQDTDFHGIDGNPPKTEPIKIGFHVWIARQVLVLKGVTIGDYSIVGAGSVVASDIPDHVIAAGNPARQIGVTKNGYS